MVTNNSQLEVAEQTKNNHSQKVKKNKKKNLLFYILMATLPLLQYAIFYIYVNIDSVLLAFKHYQIVGNGYEYVLNENIFSNFKDVFVQLFTDDTMLNTIKNSLIAYGCSLLIVTPLALIFSFYIMKKYPGSKVFRVILFIPTIICSMILVYIFQVLADNIIPEIIIKITGQERENFSKYQLLANPDTRFTAILFFSLFLSFGVNVLMYTSAMSGVSTDILEAADIDGCGDFRAFWHIIIPSVFPTLTTFIVVGVAGIFTNQMYVYDLKGPNADSSIWTLGYYLYKETVGKENSIEFYPFLSAMGLVFTLIATPVSMLVKWAFEKFGPSEE